MPLYAPEYLFHPEGWLQQYLLELDEEGTVVALRKRRPKDRPVELSGYLVPGFVNAHCHLELSYLAGQVAPGIGMTGFIQEQFRLRKAGAAREEKQQAMAQALGQMHATGTVAVGDICNGTDSVALKQAQPALAFHSFLELPGLDPARADQVWTQGQELLRVFEGMDASLTPHAPYSMSEPLLRKIYAVSGHISVHLLESREEVQFLAGGGPMAEAFRQWHLEWAPFPEYHPVDYVLRGLSPGTRAIWVHNLYAAAADLQKLIRRVPASYFCLCPRSNQYLHGRCPELSRFAAVQDRVCLGTDSLASNWSLDMWEEVKTVLALPDAPRLHTVVRWATLQGAEALGMSRRLGQFRPGTRPGVLRIDAEQTKCARLL